MAAQPPHGRPAFLEQQCNVADLALQVDEADVGLTSALVTLSRGIERLRTGLSPEMYMVFRQNATPVLNVYADGLLAALGTREGVSRQVLTALPTRLEAEGTLSEARIEQLRSLLTRITMEDESARKAVELIVNSGVHDDEQEYLNMVNTLGTAPDRDS